jgi:hypothetical protein
VTSASRGVSSAARGILSAVAVAQAWLFRHEISPDGVAYLDLSDAIVTGRFGELVNGYWSPLYPALIGAIRLVVGATPLSAPQHEFVLIHVANVLCFVAALAAFEWFLRTIDDAGAGWGQQLLGSVAGRLAAYALFGIAMLDMISLKGTVPDLLLAATCFAAFACVQRLHGPTPDRRTALMLGAAIAIGALTKSIMFPLGVVMLLCVAFSLGRRGRWTEVVVASASFALIALPWVVALSLSLGRFSTGEAGALNYAWYVNGKQPPNSGVMPALAAPGEPVPLDGLAVLPDGRGTNPLWYDPTRWHRDVRPSLSVSQQRPRLIHSARYYAYVLAPFVLILVAVAAASRYGDLRLAWERTYVVLIPCLAGVAAYSLVYTTSRYVAPFVVAGCVAVGAAFPRGAPLSAARLLAALPLTLAALFAISPLRGRLWLAAAAALMVGGIWMALHRRHGDTDSAHRLRRMFAAAVIVAAALPGLLFGGAAVRAARGDANPQWTTAQRLMTGIAAGSKIAVLGNPENSGWARLARYRIIAVIPPERVDAFRKLSDAERARIEQVFRRAGAVQLLEIAP